MVSSSLDPSLPTAAELAGDTPADGMNIDQPSERQARHSLARRAQLAHQYNTIPPGLYAGAPKPLNPSQDEGPGQDPAEG
eukprot:scaffold615_cov125-Isochrysis_galbana.AAC.1